MFDEADFDADDFEVDGASPPGGWWIADERPRPNRDEEILLF